MDTTSLLKKPKDISSSAFAYLFGELVSECLGRVSETSDLERRYVIEKKKILSTKLTDC